MRRIAVTGMGVICPLGSTPEQAFANAAAGRSAVGRIQAPWSAQLASPLGAAVEFNAESHFEPPRLRMLDRVSQFALLAARAALEDAGGVLETVPPQRVGVFFGTGMGGWQSTDDAYRTLYRGSGRIPPYSLLQAMAHAPAAWIGLDYGLTGPNLTYSTACSSSAVAIGEAWLRLRAGQIDVAIAGGAEAPLCLGALAAWEALHALAREDPVNPARSCKPFAADRTGMVMGEGAAVLVLEPQESAERRGRRAHAELTGYGTTTDAAHMTRPTVAGQAHAMRAALHSADCPAQSIDHINAHGTGTPANDAVETAAIKEVFGTHAAQIPISATKAMHGHLLGASGALELVLALLSLRSQVLLPTMHLEHPAPECDLDYVANRSRAAAHLRTVMSNSFAFGGTNAVLVARAADS